MAKTQEAAGRGAPAVDTAQEDFRRLLFEAPIAELAENQGISIDEAVRLRVEQAVAEMAAILCAEHCRPAERLEQLLHK